MNKQRSRFEFFMKLLTLEKKELTVEGGGSEVVYLFRCGVFLGLYVSLILRWLFNKKDPIMLPEHIKVKNKEMFGLIYDSHERLRDDRWRSTDLYSDREAIYIPTYIVIHASFASNSSAKIIGYKDLLILPVARLIFDEYTAHQSMPSEEQVNLLS